MGRLNRGAGAVKDLLRRACSARRPTGGIPCASTTASTRFLRRDMATPFGAQSAWRQITDLIGRRRVAGDAGSAGAVAVDPRRWCRRRCAPPARAAWPSPRRLPALVRLFGEDDPSIAAPILSTARLDASDWLAMHPRFAARRRGRCCAIAATCRRGRCARSTVTARPISRCRSPTSDRRMTCATTAPRRADARQRPRAGRSDRPVRDRRTGRAARRVSAQSWRPQPPAAPDRRRAGGARRPFLFRNRRDGHDPLGRRRAARTIDRRAARRGLGAGRRRRQRARSAAARRSPMRAWSSTGSSAAAGDWQMSATPAFEPASGRFTGYRGVARRPRADERAEPIRANRPAAEALRALVHELRTPTNAISGFAEMIEAQVLGPAPDVYRDMRRDDPRQHARVARRDRRCRYRRAARPAGAGAAARHRRGRAAAVARRRRPRAADAVARSRWSTWIRAATG